MLHNPKTSHCEIIKNKITDVVIACYKISLDHVRHTEPKCDYVDKGNTDCGVMTGVHFGSNSVTEGLSD